MGATFDKTLTIAVETIPIVTSESVTTIDEDSVYSYTLSASDADGDTVTWSVNSETTLPSWMQFNEPAIETILDSNISYPSGIAVDQDGNVYIADTDNNAIKKIDREGNVITLLGTNLHNPFGVAIDQSGNVYIADTYNNSNC